MTAITLERACEWRRRLPGAGLLAIVFACALAGALPAAAQNWHVRLISLRTLPPLVTLRAGSIPTRDGLALHLTADRGSVVIFTDADNEVRYQVRAETEQGDAAAALTKAFSFQANENSRGVTLNGQLPARGGLEHVWVSYEIHVPRRYSLAISSKAGDIVAEDIQGRMVLETGGGNIRAGSVTDPGKEAHGDLAANLETGGGNIVVGDVSGSLRAVTAGGHISAGNVGGDATIRTDGGHIEIGQVRGNEQLSTGGGNIAAARADDVAAATDGGRIEFGDAAGTIRANSNGGGIRIGHITAPTELDSQSGSVFVAGIEAPLRASAKDGGITAWFSPRYAGASGGHAAAAADPQSSRSATPSELISGRGDIVVYLPRAMAVNIDALIDQGSGHRIVADPSLQLKARMDDSSSGHALHVQGAMNGGGSVLHLETGSGDIRLRLLDTDTRQWLAGVQAAMAQQEMMQRAFLREMEQEVGALMEDGAAESPAQVEPRRASDSSVSSGAVSDDAIPGGWIGIARLFEGFWHGGGIWVNPDEQQKRLLQAVRPVYPEAAREAGLEGDVTLQVEIGPDGAVKDVRPFSGDPELARAAINAVSQWRYAPALLDGRPMGVVTTVTLAFRLR